jgi:predicted CopG family antitoxin
MGTKTIGITEGVYEQLKARKREDESFTDLVDRLLEETAADWQEGFGALSEAEATELEEAVQRAQTRSDEGLAARQSDAVERLADAASDDTDETA